MIGNERHIVTINNVDVDTSVLAPNDWMSLIATFVASQDVKESSRALYTRTLKLFFEWLERKGKPLDGLSRIDILEYKDELLSEGLSPLTVGSYLTSCRRFFEWAEGEGLCRNIARGVRTPRRKQIFKKQHLSHDKSIALLDYYRIRSPRDFAIINLLLRTGLRTIEVVRANVEDISIRNDKRVLKVWGKARDSRDDFVVLTDKAYEPIRAYLDTRRSAKGLEPLFTSCSPQNKGKRLTTRTISYICKEGLKAVGLDSREYSAHSLRHTAAVEILRHGGQLTDVQNVLRHSSPVTSEIYVESIKEELRLANAPEELLDEAY